MAVADTAGRGTTSATRAQLTHLVGRDTERPGRGEIARAVIESVAENTSDAVVAPLLWGAWPALPGLLGYRAVNTLDAMVGHRSARYERFGWAAARLDDVLNLPGARPDSRACGRCSATTPRPPSCLASRRGRAPEPERRPGRGGLRRRAGRPARRRERLRARVEDRHVLGDGRPRLSTTSPGPGRSRDGSVPRPPRRGRHRAATQAARR